MVKLPIKNLVQHSSAEIGHILLCKSHLCFARYILCVAYKYPWLTEATQAVVEYLDGEMAGHAEAIHVAFGDMGDLLAELAEAINFSDMGGLSLPPR